MIHPVILSGGSGTRLWPLSREHYPKQFLPLIGNLSMFQQTFKRMEGFQSDLSMPIVVCNSEHRFLVAEQLRQIEQLSSHIILEPDGRNTAPALTLAALAMQDTDNDPLLLVMPADHVIQDVAAFHQAITQAAELAEKANLVTFGITPDHAATGYGYIKTGAPVTHTDIDTAFTIASFVEKPDQACAQAYLDSGEYLWNSGMFMLRASVWLEAIGKYRPDILQACRQAYQQGVKDLDFYRIDEDSFSRCPSESIDYAVMEHLTEQEVGQQNKLCGVVVPLDAGWSDVGAWSSLWEISPQDKDGNVVQGDVYLNGSANNMVHADYRLVAGIGIRDLVIVETADAVMVAHKDHAQEVKQAVNWLKAQGRNESLMHRKVARPWGSYEGVVAGERFQVKRIIVKPGETLSLQMHHHRAEHWVVVKGTARVTRGEEVYMVAENESTYIPIGVKHRLENPGVIPLEIIEVQSGAYLGEDDIVRFDDRYGRKETPDNTGSN